MHFRPPVLTVILIAAVGSVSAYSCGPGTWSSSGRSPCQKCPGGTYQSQSGQTSCTHAQPGWYATGPGATAEVECGPGYYSTGSATSCTICPAGTYCNGSGRTSPQACEPGRFAASPGSGQDCKECPAGTFNDVYGATSCCSCCSGWYTDQTGQTHCFNCPNRGSFSQGWSPVGASSSNQCIAAAGALSSCAQTEANSCPSTGGSSPSQKPGHQSQKRRNIPLPQKPGRCPKGHKNCPVLGVSYGRGFAKTFQCVDTDNELESCGGCVNDDSPDGTPNAQGGRDCSTIPNVDAVRCSGGKCLIDSCLLGYGISSDGTKCYPVFF